MYYEYGPKYIQSVDMNDEDFLMSLSRDEDYQVVEKMGEECGSVLPRWKKIKSMRK